VLTGVPMAMLTGVPMPVPNNRAAEFELYH
jgi:hypothetical protein